MTNQDSKPSAQDDVLNAVSVHTNCAKCGYQTIVEGTYYTQQYVDKLRAAMDRQAAPTDQQAAILALPHGFTTFETEHEDDAYDVGFRYAQRKAAELVANAPPSPHLSDIEQMQHAKVDGLTFEQIEDAFPEVPDGVGNEGFAKVSAPWLHEFAHNIERVLLVSQPADIYADNGQQNDNGEEPLGPNHPAHHDGMTCERAAQVIVDQNEEMLRWPRPSKPSAPIAVQDDVVRDAALEDAAKVCDAIHNDKWDQYKGRGAHEPNNPNRADAHTQGEAYGADGCADAIRALKSTQPSAAPIETRSFCGGAPNPAILKMVADDRAAQDAQLNSDWGDAAPVEAAAAMQDTPIPWQKVVQAIRAVAAEAAERGKMFPQTSDEQRDDAAAARRVIGLVDWYANHGGSVAERLPDWPKIPRPTVPTLTDEQCERIRVEASTHADSWVESQAFEPTQAQMSGEFVRAIIKAAYGGNA